MRNLKTVSRRHTNIRAGLPLSATAWDASDDSIICAFGPTTTQPLIELKRRPSGSSDLTLVTSWDAPCPLPELDCDEILLLQYFADTSTSCLVLAGGDIVVVREKPSDDEERIEIVGSVDAGIAAAAWAPDEELLAIVTRADTLVLMSRSFEPVTETTLTADDLQASKHVSVGWGKKETQFHGKRAKAMRDPTMPDTVDKGRASPFDDGKTSISWRGDGAYFAVNNIAPDYRRVIRVFSREAVLDSASEPVDGLESSLSWRPAGNIIAGVKRSSEKLEVVFFERNGLRHGQFELRLSKSDMETWAAQISLAWNIDSTVLAVVFLDRLQLWTMGNYHYYLKQEVLLRPSRNTIAAPNLRWHPEAPLNLVLSTSDNVLDLSYVFTFSRDSLIPPYDYGTVAVIDGRTLKLTPLKHVGVPPPMAFCEIQFSHNIVDCAVSRDGERLAVLTTDSLEFCTWNMRNSDADPSISSSANSKKRHTQNITSSSNQLSLETKEDLFSHQFTQVVFQGNDELYIIAPGNYQSSTCLRQILWPSNGALATLTACDVLQDAQTIFTDSLQETVWAADRNKTMQIGISGDCSKHEFDLTGSEQSIAMFNLPVNPGENANGYRGSEYHQVTLSANGSLKVDGQILARDCSSFALTNAHLVFTTMQHLLKFVHLTDPLKMEVPGNTPEVDERCRSIERGAKIVTVIPSIYAVVLQMPRGNLETIYPRLLVLSGIRHHLQLLDYRTAFLACQNHQVDMNILYDYQPETFISNVPKVIEQLKKPNRIDEFLSKLKDEDVTQTFYRDTLTGAGSLGPAQINANGSMPKEAVVQSQNKVNRICDAFLEALSFRRSSHLRNIITAHVCKRPPDLTAALSLVSSLRESSEDEADLAVSHLCFLTDTNRLYDAALALYDLELALLVAQNAQRDPREYMPFLQMLQDLPVARRQYQIDDHLRNYAKALTSLHALKAYDEVEAYSVKHNLYKNALDLYRYDQTRLLSMTRLYADYLSSQSKHAAAANLYESLGDYNSAYPLYGLAHQWREALACACLIPLDPEPLRDLAASLAATCADESRDYRSGATIHADYLKNIPAAARLLCKGSYFSEASRILAMHSLAEDIPLIIDSGLNEKFSEIIELVADCKSQLAAQLPRIKDLRQKKEEDPLAFYGGDAALMNADGPDIPDNISLAATDASTIGGQSLFTRYGSNASKFGGTVASNVSRKTSKTKRREERKRARGKKGSVYEEEYLVSSVARLIERVNGVHDEVRRLVSGLFRRNMREQAAKVEEVMAEITELCSKAKEEVWHPQISQNPQTNETRKVDLDREERPSGADGVLWDSQMEMDQRTKEAPIVRDWVRSDLLS